MKRSFVHTRLMHAFVDMSVAYLGHNSKKERKKQKKEKKKKKKKE